jgi:lipid A 3-O-deacylase
VHFTSHLAVNYRFRRGPQIGYQFQHKSNAGLEDPNPGLDMHMLTVMWPLK